MPHSAGDKLGPYQILAPIGAGGMGEVYLAHDSKLNRDVALKVLSAALSQDVGYLARFQREAQVLASLNHPNIAQIYGLEQNAIVMELVEGQEPHGPLPITDALQIARQVADALEAAHEKGIVHRDLKPANIKIKADGTVKVLDFGLAKATEPAAPASNANSPTLTIGATQAGVILGTAAYMAPEQAAGKPVDRRADIWSFGVVLWELLVGKRLFNGETISHTLADVLRAPIDLEALPKETPPAIKVLVRRCLERDIRKRLQWIGDGRIAIEEALANPHPAPAADSPRSSSKAWIAIACALALVAAAVSFVHFRETPPELPPLRATILPPDNTTLDLVTLGLPAVSPDGRRIVFSARTADGKAPLWVRPLDALTAQPLAGTEGASFPFWSPDSRFIGFFADGKLRKIDASGGPAIPLADAPAIRGGSWSPLGVILFGGDIGSALQRVSASGGEASPLSGVIGRLPWFLPDGRHFLYGDPRTGLRQSNVGRLTIRAGSLDGGEGKKLLDADTNAVYAEGHLLFMRGDALMAQPFDAKRLETTGEAVPVAQGIQSVMNNGSAGVFSVSQTGMLAFRSGGGEPATVLTWFDRDGKRGAAVGEPAILGSNFRISPDQKSLAAEIGERQANMQIWIYDLARGLRTRFILDTAPNLFPSWSPDGGAIAFAYRRKEHYDLYRKAANGAGPEELLYADDLDKYPTSWSPDGKFLLYQTIRDPAGIWALPLTPDQPGGPRKPFPVVQFPLANSGFGQFSPDGRWIAYQSNESGRSEVYATPFPPGAGGKRQISNAGGARPEWRRDGKEIFYEGPGRRLMAAEVAVKGGALEVGQVRPLFVNTGGSARNAFPEYGVTADGQRFLIPMPIEEKSSEPLTLIQNWTAGLKK
jgi:serine/threonine protein kinase/Tol biopolymer transport system component